MTESRNSNVTDADTPRICAAHTRAGIGEIPTTIPTRFFAAPTRREKGVSFTPFLWTIAAAIRARGRGSAKITRIRRGRVSYLFLDNSDTVPTRARPGTVRSALKQTKPRKRLVNLFRELVRRVCTTTRGRASAVETLHIVGRRKKGHPWRNSPQTNS